MLNLRDTPTTYSVSLLEDGWVRVTLIGGIFNHDIPSGVKDLYPSLDDVPSWIQDKLAALIMCEPDPSYNIKDVGRRLSKNSYWVEYTSGA